MLTPDRILIVRSSMRKGGLVSEGLSSFTAAEVKLAP